MAFEHKDYIYSCLHKIEAMKIKQAVLMGLAALKESFPNISDENERRKHLGAEYALVNLLVSISDIQLLGDTSVAGHNLSLIFGTEVQDEQEPNEQS